MTCAHPLNAQGQADGDYRRQPFWYGGHRQAHARHEHGLHRFAARHAQRGHGGADQEARQDDPPSKLRQAPLKRSLSFRRPADHAGDRPYLSVHTRAHHYGFPAPARDHSPGVQHVAMLRHRGGLAHDGVGVFARRPGLACERRFVRFHPVALRKTCVSRNPIALPQKNDVAGHELRRVHVHRPPLPQHGGMRRRQPAQGGQCPLGPEFLHKAEERVHHDYGENRRHVPIFAEHGGDGCCPEQHQNHEVLELPGQHGQDRRAARRLDLVGPVCCLPRLHVPGFQPACCRSLQLPLNHTHTHRMPCARHRHLPAHLRPLPRRQGSLVHYTYGPLAALMPQLSASPR